MPMSDPSNYGAAATAHDRSRDEELRGCIRRLTEADQDALASLYDCTSSFVYGIALRLLNDRADAEEVTLDVYAQIWRSASTFDSERGSVLGWLSTITRTRSIDRLRTRARRSEREIDTVPDQASSEPSPEDRSLESEQQRRVQAALSALPENQRQVIELACFSGCTHSEIAERTGLPLGTVKTRLRLALIRLRELLATGGGPLQ